MAGGEGCGFVCGTHSGLQTDFAGLKEKYRMKQIMKKITLLILTATIAATTVMATGCKTSIAERRNDTSSTLYVGYVSSAFPTTFFPWSSRDGIAPTVASFIYNTLFSLDTETNEYLPSLAKDWCYTDLEGNEMRVNGEIDYDEVERYYSDDKKDYMVVKVTLHDNATWSDGEPVTVEDVYYTFDIATDNTRSGHAGALAWTADFLHNKTVDGKTYGQGIFTYDHNGGGKYQISEAEKDTVLYLHVKKALGAIAMLFTTILILPEHIWAPLTENGKLVQDNATGEVLKQYENPIGCGAWTLEESSRQMIVLKNRGTDYHLKAADGSALYQVDTLKFMLYLEQNTAIYALLKGHIDILDASMSSNYLKLFEKEEDIYVSNVGGTASQTLVLNVNPQEQYRTPMRDLFKNIDFRKAIALAINQSDIIRNVLNGAGTTASAGLMLPQSENDPMYNPASDIFADALWESDGKSGYENRLEEANRILDGLYPEKDGDGYRLLNGTRISYEILANPGELELVSYLQQQFQKIGIEVEYKAEGSMAEDTYLFAGNFDMTFQATIFNAANVDTMYDSHFISTSRSSNYGRLADAALTEKIGEMEGTLNENEKYSLIRELQVMIAQLYYKIPVYSSNVISVARDDRFTNYTASAGETVFNEDTLKQIQKVV